MSLDALENRPEEAPRQVAFSELQGEVPCMPDQPSARQDEPPQRIAEVVGDDPEREADLVGPESRVQWVAVLPSLIHCSGSAKSISTHNA